MPRAKKSSKKSSAKSMSTSSAPLPSMAAAPVGTMSPQPMPKMPKMSPRLLTGLLIVIAIALATYKFGPWLVPAIVGGRPVTRLAVWDRLETTYGAQTFDDMINEAVLDQAIASSGVTVEQTAVDSQLDSLNQQFESLGGLDEALKERGLTRTELEKQIRTQLAVEQILADQVTVTDEEVQAEYDSQKDSLYQDREFETVKAEIETGLRDSRLRDAFLAWFAQIKEEAQIKNFGL